MAYFLYCRTDANQLDQVTVKQMMDAAHAIVMQSVNAIEEEEEEIDWLQAELEELSRVCHLLQEEKASEIRSGRQALLRAGQGLTTESEFDEHRERMHFAFHRVEDKSVEWLEALTHLIELRRALWKKWLGTTQKAMVSSNTYRMQRSYLTECRKNWPSCER